MTLLLQLRLAKREEAALRREAKRRHLSLEAYFQNAVRLLLARDRYLDPDHLSAAYRSGKDLFGCYDSGNSNQRKERKSQIRSAVRAKHARRSRAH